MTRAEYRRRAKVTWSKRRELARLRIWVKRYDLALDHAPCVHGHGRCSIRSGGPCLVAAVREIRNLERQLGTKKGGGNDPA
jgi:hypothetical protein